MRGGKRKGAGRKKGTTLRISPGQLAQVLGPQVTDFYAEMLQSKNKRDRKWAAHDLREYVFQKQPQQQILTGGDGNDINVTVRIIG